MRRASVDMRESLFTPGARVPAWLPLILLLGACGETVVDHDRPCAANLRYDDVWIEADDPPERLEALRGVTEVVGDVTLSGSFESLEPLSCLSRVHGRFSLSEASVDSLDGLEALERVGGLELSGLSALTDVEALAGLRQVDDGLTLWQLPAVEDLSSLAGITELRGLIVLYDLPPQIALGLSLPEQLDGALIVEGDVPDLRAVTAGLREVTGGLDLHGASIAQVDLGALESVGGVLSLTARDTPMPMPPMPALREVGGPLELRGLTMADLSDLAALESVGHLTIEQCEALQTLDGLEQLRSVVSHEPVEGAGHAGGGVTLHGNPSLVDLHALAGITEVVGSEGGPGLLWLGDNAQLASVEGTGALAERVHQVILDQLPALEDLQGWSGLSRLGGLSIHGTGLHSLDGLSLTPDAQFGPDTLLLDLQDNAKLVDVAPLIPQPGQVVPTEGYIGVEGSAQLGRCQVEALIDQARAQGFGGEAIQQGLLDDGPC